MHNVKVEALKATIEQGRANPASTRQTVEFGGEWQVEEGVPQFRGTIPFPGGEVAFEADFPPPLGGGGLAPNPLAYCFWGGLACYAMTFAQEAALRGVELRSLRARVTAEVNHSRALGISDDPPVDKMEWHLEAQADVPEDQLQELKRLADEHCPGVWCVTNPVDLVTRVSKG